MSSGEPLLKPGDIRAESPEAPGRSQEHIQALGELFRAHNRDLVRYLVFRCGSREEALDVAQDAYASMLALDSPGTVSFLAGYLWKTARNLALNRKRDQVSRARLNRKVESAIDPHAPSPEGAVYSQQLVAVLERALEGLTGRAREVFILRYFDELSVKEVAQRLDISERKVYAHAARAIDMLERAAEAGQDGGNSQ